jgi:uncharacterized membrane protein
MEYNIYIDTTEKKTIGDRVVNFFCWILALIFICVSPILLVCWIVLGFISLIALFIFSLISYPFIRLLGIETWEYD